MERAAIVLLLFTLSSPAPGTEGRGEPSALVQQISGDQHRGVEPWMLVGAWRGSRGTNGSPLEVIFSSDIRPAIVVAHFTLIEEGVSHSVRRVGRLSGGEVRFALVGGGQIVLRLIDQNRLVGGLVTANGEEPAPTALGDSMELSRLRPR